MSKLSKKEKDKIERQMGIETPRGDIWRVRSSVMHNKAAKYNKKVSRREGRQICKEA